MSDKIDTSAAGMKAIAFKAAYRMSEGEADSIRTLAAERDALAARVQELEAEIERMRSAHANFVRWENP